MARPNIVLIVADDMGYGDFSAFNGGLSSTPTLDHLMSEGLCLTQHYTGSPVCAPSRASLMTGRYSLRTGAIDTLEGRGLDRLNPCERTVGDYFTAAGYATGLVGKWHLGALDPRYHPNARGFGEFAGFRGGWQDYYQWRLDRNGDLSHADGRYLTDVITDEAVSFIERHCREPFCLHVAYNAPHFPFQAPESDLRGFAERGEFTAGVSNIYGMIRCMDRGVERLLEELARQGISENTIVMFTSDNGPQFGGQGDWCTDRFNCGFNGAKGSVLEGGIRLPMILRWPGHLPAGVSCDRMVHFTDWLPTLLAAAQVPDAVREAVGGLPLDGCNILPVLQGEGGDVPTQRFWQWNRYTPVVTSNAAVRDGDWKLVRSGIAETMTLTQEDLDVDSALKYEPDSIVDITRSPEPERVVPEAPAASLFNIKTDPLEQEDLACREPERAAKMLCDLETWFESVEADRIAGKP